MHSHLWEDLLAPFTRDQPSSQKKGKAQATQTSILTTRRCRRCIMPTPNHSPSLGLSMQRPSSWTCRGTPQPQWACLPRPLSKPQGTNLLLLLWWELAVRFSPGLTAAPQPGPSMTPQRVGSLRQPPQMSWCTRCHRAHRKYQVPEEMGNVMFLKKSFEGYAAFFKHHFKAHGLFTDD